MTLDEEVEVLKRIPLFSKIDKPKLKLLAFTSERVVFHSGETVCRQGDAGDAAFIIVDGTADILINGNGSDIKVAEVGRNAIIGEVAILIDVPRTATVAATSELITLRITKEPFFNLVQEFPEIAVEIMRVLAHRLEATNEKLRLAKT